MDLVRCCNLLSSSKFSGSDKGRNSTKSFTVSGVISSKGCIRALGSQNQTRKLQKRDQKDFLQSSGIEDENNKIISSDIEVEDSVIVPPRSAVLQACTVTSASMAALALLIRQVSHIVSSQGWPVVDTSADVTFSLESWHLGLIMGSVILVSSSRFLLLKIWPDFAESSEAANQQILTSLEPLDYLVVAFLPGISEELLFRGALLPLFGINFTSIFSVAALFGVLHLGSGRKYSFAIWATLVGIVYGYGTSLSSSMVVPMASHALNNLVGGIVWRYYFNSSKHIG